MGDSTHDTKLQALGLNAFIEPGRLLIIIEGAAQRIANLIGESSDTGHLRDIRLHTQLFCGQRTLTCTPALAIYKYGGIDGIDSLADLVHRLNIMTSHQVEAEPVDMIFVDPVFHRLYHELPHHRLLRGGLIATARAVGISAIITIFDFLSCKFDFRPTRIVALNRLTIIIIRICTLETTLFYIKSMIIDNIKNHTDPCLMKCLNHLFELTDTALRIHYICSITAFWDIIIQRIIPPIILRYIWF